MFSVLWSTEKIFSCFCFLFIVIANSTVLLSPVPEKQQKINGRFIQQFLISDFVLFLKLKRRYNSSNQGRGTRRNRRGKTTRPAQDSTRTRRIGNAEELRWRQVETRQCGEVFAATDRCAQVSTTLQCYPTHIYCES